MNNHYDSRERDPFLESYEWRTVRMRVLERDGAKCACCGATAADGAVMNVDHIKNRRQYPELALTESNLQVLCAACNHGKGNKYDTDWRRENTPITSRGRRTPSLVRELITGLLLQPELARTEEVPEPQDGTAEGAALTALARFCGTGEHPLTTAGVMQNFAGTAYEKTLTDALCEATENGISEEQAAEHLRAGVRRYWQQAQRARRPIPVTSNADEPPLTHSPPHSLQAEQCVLGGLLLDNQAVYKVVDVLPHDDFYSEAHQVIYKHILVLLVADKLADVVTVSESLAASQKLDYVGGLEYLGLLIDNVPTASNILQYAQIIIDRAERRREI